MIKLPKEQRQRVIVNAALDVLRDKGIMEVSFRERRSTDDRQDQRVNRQVCVQNTRCAVDRCDRSGWYG